MIAEFVDATTHERVRELEKEFMKSYTRLARKEDQSLRATIDHKTFDVELVDENNKAINKNELSAGEKQIYAIAVLEALAKTSGRSRQ